MIATSIQLRYSDFDMGGHAHNAVYLQYFETARIGFFISSFGKDWDWKKNGLIVKKNTVEYHIPIFIEDEIHVEVSCIAIGTKSFTLTYSVMDSKNNLKAYGESVIVCFDYTQQRTQPVPDDMIAALRLHLAG